MREIPRLRDPIVIAAFEGWNDAAEAASAAIEHLRQVWDAETIAAIDPEDYYDYQVNRPRVQRLDTGRAITWPTTRVLLARNPELPRDVLLVDGIEPSLRWRAFVVELLDLARSVDASLLVCLGALLADVPHSRPFPVTVTSEDPTLIRRHALEPSSYEGPTGIVGVLADAATQAELPALSCWAAVPHYAAGAVCPKAVLALLRRLESVLDLTIPHLDLQERARTWERSVDELAASDDEVAEYVRVLEQAQDTADHPEASGDAIAREFERYLRRRGGEPSA